MTHLELIDAAGIQPMPTRWLWPGWLARGKLHVVAGAPGSGKTTISLAIASAITRGAALPSGWCPERGSVLIWSGEDDPADTLVPRLLAAGADLRQVRFVGDVHDRSGARAFDPAYDVAALAEASAGMRDLSLLIVDPLVSAVAGDSHKNAEVRRGLQPLVNLAAERGVALLGITHLSKGTQGRDPLERLTGSLAFGALARVVYGTARQQAEDGELRRFTFARIKSNIGPDGGGFAYSIEHIEIEGGISTSKVMWGDAVEGEARELLAEPVNDEGNAEARSAIVFLRDLLATGALPVKTVRKHADESGFAWRTVQRAMRAAGIESKRGGFGLPATWSLPVAPVAPVAPCVSGDTTAYEDHRAMLAPSLFHGANGTNGANECTASAYRLAHGGE